MTRLAALLACLAALPAAAGEVAPGEKLATFACGRCHVVSEATRYGGIGSTPSFAALRTLPDWEERFRSFYALRPHPAFSQVAGVTPPFPPARPSPIHPIELTEDELDRIVEYARTIPPRDLGAPIRFR